VLRCGAVGNAVVQVRSRIIGSRPPGERGGGGGFDERRFISIARPLVRLLAPLVTRLSSATWPALSGQLLWNSSYKNHRGRVGM
jgi:hypothetical protein